MKNSVLTMILVMMMTVWAIAQERPVLTLDSCHSMAVEHNPLTKQRNLYEEAFRLQSKSIGSNYLPQTTLYALASWQSEVTGFPVSLPGIEIPAVSNDNYKIYLDVNQLIWDGGSVRRQKELEASSMQIDLAGVDAENYRLKESINQLYFSILQFQANEKLLILAMDELYTRLAVLRAGISNGTILPSNADVLDAEIAVIGQALTDLRYNKSAGLYKLGELTGLNTGPETRLILPEYENLPLSLTDTKARPEYRIFGMQQEKISRQISLTGIRVMPRLSAFTTLGYGRPGLNMLSNDFESYAMLGARFSWKLWDWNQHRNDQSVLSVQQQIIDTRKEAFEMTQRIALNSLKQEILRIENLIAADHRIVELRKKVAMTAAARLDQGIITSSEYLIEQNALTKAELNLELHKIQLQQSRLNYISTMGYLK
ncbi:hypothetical protein SDC9_21934 [bioreactor metagenome]|jgi:outer membrane protein TolC|uniref:TolC family protein n=1 Tax=bioreactor metagenome TaxID=1076179 RepID=A0A644UAT4_9ZZZZ|nr:TolC family protein [Lentimicrobium sp.]MEA5111454.1 TolC family protein [Lentimicrobium sp.]